MQDGGGQGCADERQTAPARQHPDHQQPEDCDTEDCKRDHDGDKVRRLRSGCVRRSFSKTALDANSV
ncbi:MAG: hypothetical protein BroJett003_17340 [Planctomycetota bacterium]|nr:MAG: hypothetical protein BroJett003_17340 [Planctomycetota bacterium]